MIIRPMYKGKVTTMKAYNVFVGDPMDGCVLVFAETANRARAYAAYRSDWCGDWDYIDTSAIRNPRFDQYCIGIKRYAISANNELPDGARPFYSDDDDI